MGVNHGGLDIFVAQQLLHGANVVAIFKQVGGKAVSERMARYTPLNISRSNGLFNCLLQTTFMEMMATANARARIDGAALCGEYILPNPFPISIRIFAFKRIGQRNRPIALGR